MRVALACLAAVLCVSLAQAAPLTYYGTTVAGGAHGTGTVFEYARGQHPAVRTIYSFCAAPNCSDGANPLGNMVALPDGSLVGTTSTGGTANSWPGDGTVFRLSPAPDGTWTEHTLYVLCFYWEDCAHFGPSSGTLTLAAPDRIVGSVSDGHGRGEVWEVGWRANGEVWFTDLHDWGKNAK